MAGAVFIPWIELKEGFFGFELAFSNLIGMAQSHLFPTFKEFRSAMISPVEVQHFRDHGYTVVRQLFTPLEIKAMLAELRRFQQEGLGRNVSTDPEAKVNYQIIPLNDKSKLFRAMPFVPKVVACISALIGDPFVRHLDQIFLKPPGLGVGTDWHQDNAYFGLEDPTKGTAMWVAMHDANLENGTLHVIPNSHLQEFGHSRDPGSDHHIHIADVEGEQVALEVRAGSVVFFNYGTAHSTKQNRSAIERAGVAFHFFNTNFELRGGQKTFLVVITGPESTGGKSEYGQVVAGTWDQEVALLTN